MSTPIPSIDAAVDRALAEHRLVGAVVLVARHGRLVYHRAAGSADRESDRPMSESARFRLASITKPIVSATALALFERGTLALDAPVIRWLPGFTPRLPDGAMPTITLRHLLTHTAGLSYGFFEPEDGPYARAGVSDGLDHVSWSLDENVRRIATVPLSYVPGTAWGYSVAHDVLGAVIQHATGEPLPDVVRAFVTGPLGLHDTDFAAVPAETLVTPYADGAPEPVRMAATHIVPFGPGRVRFAPTRATDPCAFPSGGGGMNGTARDVLTFLEAMRTGGGEALAPESARALSTNALGDVRALPGSGWGFGGAVLVDPLENGSPQAPGTLSWGGAWGHSWFVDPIHALTVVALTNTAMEGMFGRFTTELRDGVYATLVG